MPGKFPVEAVCGFPERQGVATVGEMALVVFDHGPVAVGATPDEGVFGGEHHSLGAKDLARVLLERPGGGRTGGDQVDHRPAKRGRPFQSHRFVNQQHAAFRARGHAGVGGHQGIRRMGVRADVDEGLVEPLPGSVG